MPKYETQNTFYWITREVNIVWSLPTKITRPDMMPKKAKVKRPIAKWSEKQEMWPKGLKKQRPEYETHFLLI